MPVSCQSLWKNFRNEINLMVFGVTRQNGQGQILPGR
jgi:hypothetical protein